MDQLSAAAEAAHHLVRAMVAEDLFQAHHQHLDEVRVLNANLSTAGLQLGPGLVLRQQVSEPGLLLLAPYSFTI